MSTWSVQRTLTHLKHARIKAGLTQEQVATRMGITRQALGSLESGRKDPRLSTLSRWAEGIGVELNTKSAPALISSENQLAWPELEHGVWLWGNAREQAAHALVANWPEASVYHVHDPAELSSVRDIIEGEHQLGTTSKSILVLHTGQLDTHQVEDACAWARSADWGLIVLGEDNSALGAITQILEADPKQVSWEGRTYTYGQ